MNQFRIIYNPKLKSNPLLALYNQLNTQSARDEEIQKRKMPRVEIYVTNKVTGEVKKMIGVINKLEYPKDVVHPMCKSSIKPFRGNLNGSFNAHTKDLQDLFNTYFKDLGDGKN
jgi:hypothetical protein